MRALKGEKTMVRYLAAIILALTLGAGIAISPVPAEASKSQFCAGFEQGYITGYKQASGSSFDPFVPFCPFQPFKQFSDPESDWEHGYTIGYRKGLAEGAR